MGRTGLPCPLSSVRHIYRSAVAAATPPLELRSYMKNIFVGNLDFSTRQEELRSLFESYGAVDRVTVVTDRDTGRSRGFAFVEMSADGDAEKAIAALHGRQLHGRALDVNQAMP